MSHKGFYVLINTTAPHEPHTHFGQSVGLVEFLDTVLGEGSERVRQDECWRYSTFMGLMIEAYQLHDQVLFLTEYLFSANEAALFVKMYLTDTVDGILPKLVQRREIDFSGYIRGRIALALETGIILNGRLEINFAAEGVISLPYLLEARMHYTSPRPGHFKRVEVDQSVPSILFYC
jgi:hypothetical protein